MGQKGREIVKMDVDELINLLNRALSDEWLACYQYWIGSKVVKGPMKDAVITELTLHSTEELGHAELISARIVQLGSTPVLSQEVEHEEDLTALKEDLELMLERRR